MKYECDLIRDIMPLCADDLATEASRRALSEHLAECEECTKEWENMTGTITTYTARPELLDEAKTYADTAKRIKHHRRLLIILTFVLGACIIFGSSFYYRAQQAGLCMSPEKAAIAGAERSCNMTDVEVLKTFSYANGTYEVWVKGMCERSNFEHPAGSIQNERVPVIELLGIARTKETCGLLGYTGSASGIYLTGEEGILLHNSWQSMYLKPDDQPIAWNTCYAPDSAVARITLTAYGRTDTLPVGENRLCVFEYTDANLSDSAKFSGQAYAADGTQIYELVYRDYEYIWEPCA